MAILLPSVDLRRVVVSKKWKYAHKVHVNLLVKLAQEKSVVRWTDHPDMTIAVDLDVKQKTNVILNWVLSDRLVSALLPIIVSFELLFLLWKHCFNPCHTEYFMYPARALTNCWFAVLNSHFWCGDSYFWRRLYSFVWWDSHFLAKMLLDSVFKILVRALPASFQL